MSWPETQAMRRRAGAERPVVFDGPDGPLAGIFTPPTVVGDRPQLGVVFPGRPRFASQRLAVLAARMLAAEGFACLRFDLRGHGESAGVTLPIDCAQPYGGDVAAALRFLRTEFNLQRFLLVGYCFDALTALDAFRYEAHAIEGLFFAGAPLAEHSLKARLAAPPPPRRNKSRWVAEFKLWWRAVGHHVEARRGPRACNGAAGATARILPSFAVPFEALLHSRARALFLYGERDPFYQEFKLVQRRWFAEFDHATCARIRLELWPGRVHDAQRVPAVLGRVIAWVHEFKPSDGKLQGRPSVAEDGAAVALVQAGGYGSLDDD